MKTAEFPTHAATLPYKVGDAVDPTEFARIRRRMVLEGCKWDPQVGDIATLADFPLILQRTRWEELSALAEQLAAELTAAEDELRGRPELHRRLGLPRRILRLLRDAGTRGESLRTLRFDFHWTTEGWRISEVNSDVPGGFTEASNFTAMMARHFEGMQTPGDPAERWADAIARMIGPESIIALLSAPGFMEDVQIMALLAGLLRERGLQPVMTQPSQLVWSSGFAHVQAGSTLEKLHGIVRFFQAEWLARLPSSCGWKNFFVGGRTLATNPAYAILTESKRFPLVWDDLRVELPTWRRLLPKTCDPRDARWRTDDSWLLKTALCNTGDTVSLRHLLTAKQWRRVWMDVLLHPDNWLAQQRFQTIGIDSPVGVIYPCIGVYTVEGKTAGAYARLGRRELIDFQAVDVALLVEETE